MSEVVELVKDKEDALSISESSALKAVNEWPLPLVEEFENFVMAQGLNQIDAVNQQGLADKRVDGLYCRALTIKAGTFMTGRIHLKPYIDVFISGDVTVKSFLNDGTLEDSERINSFRFFEGKAGRKRVLYAHEDTLWVTVDPTEYRGDGVPPDVVVDTMNDYLRLKA